MCSVQDWSVDFKDLMRSTNQNTKVTQNNTKHYLSTVSLYVCVCVFWEGL